MGAVWVCVHMLHLIFLPRPGQLEYQGAIKYKFFETLKQLKNKGENKNKEVKEEEKKLAFGGTYNLKQALEEKNHQTKHHLHTYSHLLIFLFREICSVL